MKKFLIASALLALFLLTINAMRGTNSHNVVIAPPEVSKKEEPKNECVDDIKKCKDNKDALLHYREIKDIKYKCRMAVNNASRYGEPDWEWSYFDQYREDNNIVAFEVVELIDNTVKIKNMYGTPEKSTVFCFYRLDTQQISSLKINGVSISPK